MGVELCMRGLVRVMRASVVDGGGLVVFTLPLFTISVNG
jgi:hypothetical protein